MDDFSKLGGKLCSDPVEMGKGETQPVLILSLSLNF